MPPRRLAGWIATLVIAAVYGGMALSVDFKNASGGIQSDEATYYLMAYSLAYDGDLEYQRADLERAYREFGTGPSGIFLKRGTDVTGIGLTGRPPFVEFPGVPDPDDSRLYFGKSYLYSLAAAPFVRVLGTNGFLALNALLLWSGFFVAFLFASARSNPWAGAVWAGAFVFASVVPVYVVWTTPELFNWSLAAVAYFFWLYKHVSPEPTSARTVWLRSGWTDLVAAALIGLLTFSKVTNVLLVLPLGAWLLWKREWRQFVLASLVTGVAGAAAFGINVASSGEWNYQGGDRATCYGTYPFQEAGAGLEVCAERGRDEALGNVIFDGEVFWSNLRHNLVYFVVGRYAGVLPYFAAFVYAALAMLVSWRRVPAWQWMVLGGVVVHGLLFVVSLPYSYFGGGGTVANRYFMGAYGAVAVLYPAAVGVRALTIPWLIGGLFTAKLILTPFQTSIRPGDYAKAPIYRWLPVELTNVNDLPINNELGRVRIWYGDSGAGDPGFQLYHLDDDTYPQDAGTKGFWVRGQARGQVLLKTDRPISRLRVTLSAGPVATTAGVRLGGREQVVTLRAGQSATVELPVGRGVPYKNMRETPAWNWVFDVWSTEGFVPAMVEPDSTDTRYLGVFVTPIILE